MEKIYWAVGIIGVGVMDFSGGAIQFLAGSIVVAMCAVRTLIEAQLERAR